MSLSVPSTVHQARNEINKDILSPIWSCDGTQILKNKGCFKNYMGITNLFLSIDDKVALGISYYIEDFLSYAESKRLY